MTGLPEISLSLSLSVNIFTINYLDGPRSIKKQKRPRGGWEGGRSGVEGGFPRTDQAHPHQRDGPSRGSYNQEKKKNYRRIW